MLAMTSTLLPHPLPDGWQLVKLGEFVEMFSGGTPKSDESTYYNGEIPWVKSGELNAGVIYETEDTITQKGFENSSAKWVEPNTVLVALYGATAGKVAMLKIKATINQAILAIVPKDERLESDYLYFLLNQQTAKILSLTQGSGQPNLNQDSFKGLYFFLPPLAERNQIVAVLQSINTALAASTTVLRQTERLKHALLQSLLSPLGKAWPQVKLGDVCELYNGRAFKPSDWGEKGTPIIRIQNLNNKDAEYNYWGGEIEEKNLVRDMDLLFSWSGSRGTSFGPFLWRGIDGVLNQHIFKVLPKIDKIYRDFLYHSLRLSTTAIEEIAHGGAGLVHITKKELEKFVIPLPPLAEQKHIAAVLGSVDARLAAERASLLSLQKIKAALMEVLLTGRRRVPLSEAAQ